LRETLIPSGLPIVRAFSPPLTRPQRIGDLLELRDG
jgi:hypothetical protein